MPVMDGLDFLSRLMRLRPMPVVMVSTLTERGAQATFRALELGARADLETLVEVHGGGRAVQRVEQSRLGGSEGHLNRHAALTYLS